MSRGDREIPETSNYEAERDDGATIDRFLIWQRVIEQVESPDIHSLDRANCARHRRLSGSDPASPKTVRKSASQNETACRVAVPWGLAGTCHNSCPPL